MSILAQASDLRVQIDQLQNEQRKSSDEAMPSVVLSEIPELNKAFT